MTCGEMVLIFFEMTHEIITWDMCLRSKRMFKARYKIYDGAAVRQG